MSPAYDAAQAPPAAPQTLTEPLPLRWLLILAAVDLLAGLWLAQLVQAAAPARHSDAALRVAALAALPLPAVLLQWLTLPVHGPARRWMGESAEQTVGRTLAFARRALPVALAIPLGVALAAIPAGDLQQPLIKAALLAALAQVLAYGLGAMALLLALGAMASGGKDLWQLLAGGGAFGPAQAAPLLYAPAGALVAALVPVAMLSAVWGARADLLGVPLLLGLLVAAALAVHRGLAGVQRSLGPQLHSGLLRVEEAHSAPFAEQLLLPPTPTWLAWSARGDSAALWLSLAWGRQRPTSLAATLGLVALGALWAAPQASAWALGALGAAIGLYSALRTVVIDTEPALHAALWLGADPGQLRQGQRQLAIALAAPAIAAAVAGWPAALGALVGAAGGWLLLHWRNGGERIVWSRLALLLYGAALAAVGS